MVAELVRTPQFEAPRSLDDLRERLAAFSPRTNLGRLIREIAAYAPAGRLDVVEELLDEYASHVYMLDTLGMKVLRAQGFGDPHCLHSHVYDTPTTARCILCGERYRVENLGIVSQKVVTDLGVKNIVDVWNSGGTALNLTKYTSLGTGTNAEAAGDTGLQTELTTEYTVNSTRPTGVISQPSNNIARVVGTITLDSGTPAVTECGLHWAASGASTLFDRFKFSAINLVGANGDGIQATISITFTSGG